jgi:hypothetical protein
MQNSLIKNWFIELKRVWLEKDIQAISSLLAESFEYYEDPFQKPLTNLVDVQKVWQEVDNQDIQELHIEVLIDDVQVGMADYLFLYKDSQENSHESRGVYYVKLDNEGRAILFKQWWVEK